MFQPAIDTNDVSLLDKHNVELGQKLLAAFYNKHNLEALRSLVQEKRAPVNYRLSYGLETKLEATFVAALFLLMETQERSALHNAIRMLGAEQGQKLFNYVETAIDFHRILSASSANDIIIPVTQVFKERLCHDAHHIRFEPDHSNPQNGSLIIAAGLRDPQLVERLLGIGLQSDKPAKENGAHVNFKGYFSDNAAVWSTVLMDYDTLRILLDNGSEHEHIGITQSSLLHWIAVVARLDESAACEEKAIRITELLLAHGCQDHPNLFGKTAYEYAGGAVQALIRASQSISILQP